MSSFSEFKQIKNSENLSSLPASEKEKEVVVANLKGIAQVCNCSADQVSSFLIRLRDLAFQTSLLKRKLVVLNMAIGQL